MKSDNKILSILKFLFPEYSIIESGMKYGFIGRKVVDDNEAIRNKTIVNQTVTSQQQIPQTVYKTPKAMQQTQQQAQQTVQKTPQAMQNSTHNRNHISEQPNKDINVINETIVYNDNRQLKANTNNLIDIFEIIEKDIKKSFWGQNEYIHKLCMAFKRPFVTGYNNMLPKNIVFLLGQKSSGKHYSIQLVVKEMKKHNLANVENVACVDLSRYQSPNDKSVFLSDIYAALYSKSDVITFDNYEYCHSSIIGIMQELCLSGKYLLDGRYTMNNNVLTEVTGSMVENIISQISTNNKFFIFVSESDENKICDVFGNKFMDAIGDIINIEPYKMEDIYAIIEYLLKVVLLSVKNNLNIIIDNRVIQYEIVEYFGKLYRSNTGINGINTSIEKELYKPLSEYKMNNSIKDGKAVLMKGNNGLIIIIDATEVDLSQYKKKEYTADLDVVKKELDSIIGLGSVKQYVLDLEDNLKIQKMREDSGKKLASISKHMIFIGNPGTGKTTIARIVAKYMKALGLLSGGQLREVTRADLVGQYIGHTAQLTRDVIKSAIGGVLFIDEAYSLCRDKEDTFGLEAIDTLVKGIEDNRDDLVVILAGYENEMNEFLGINSGLKSRFPNIIEFQDYSVEEMYDILIATARSKGYTVNEDCKDSLLKLFERKQIKGRNDSGNGRLVRNIIEEAIVKQSKRLLNSPEEDMDILILADFNINNFDSFNLEESLSKIIGLENVKEFIRGQHKVLIANEKRRSAGVSVDSSQTLNMIFMGNPGTGKTTVARVVAEMLRDMGLLKSGQLIETDRSVLVSEYAGQTAKKTEEIFKTALGGVLFIDEAYALSKDGSGCGKEVIDTLVKLMEDYRGEIVVILAGYRKEMEEFLKTNSGLESRFPLQIEFKDYSANELYQIALTLINTKGFILNNESEKALEEVISQRHKYSDANSGNGRMIRNIIEEILRNQSSRIASSDISNEELVIITKEDILQYNKTQDVYDLEAELSKIVGLEEVKDFIRGLNAKLRIQSERKKMGLPVDSEQTLHMIFTGNPGTGKTTVARIISEVLYRLGVIKTNRLIETDRAGLVAGFVGQTAIKTTEKVKEAMDGVLFIDEAYSLASGGDNDFGREAIDTLVKLIDDNRGRLVVILAGYNKEMQMFLQTNTGLKSRFPNFIDFVDYSTDELMQIAKDLYESKGYVLSDEAKDRFKQIVEEAKNDTTFGNGRYVRNMFEKSLNKQALRLSTDSDLTREELITIEAEDIRGM